MEGRVVSHYRIIEKLGEGGMGVVYRAQDLNLPRLVALKFLAEGLLSSPQMHRRFVQEAGFIASLSHPNIATIYEFGLEGPGAPFLALEYLPGGTLRTSLLQLEKTARLLPLGKVLDYAVQIAEGLAHAHRKGIVHRDVKAANALFASDGTIKITDFGLSKFHPGEPDTTRSGSTMGTPAYMAPEQLENREVDHRCDIFSFGVVIYEMAAGALPFRAEHEAGLLYQIVHAAPLPLRKRRPDIPEPLERIVERLLQKNPDHRYQQMDEALADLHSVAGSVQSGRLAPTTTLPLPAGRISLTRKKRPWLWLVPAMLLLLALIVVGIPSIRTHAFDWFRPIPAQKTLIVLPFANIHVDQALCDGLQETLTSKLTQLEEFHDALRVAPASDVREAGISSVREARASFGVNLALTGSVQRVGNGYRLTANLVDTRSLVQIRTATMDVSEGDLSALQDGLVQRVTEMLELELHPPAQRALARGNTAVPRAYDYFVLGRGYLQRYDRPENLDNALAMFKQAFELDSKYAVAYAGAAEAHLRKFELTRDPIYIDLARTNSLHAIELNPQLAQVHVTMGLVDKSTGRYEDAVREFQTALKLDSVNADAQSGLAKTFEAMGKPKEAESMFRRAIDLRPNDWAGYSNLGAFCFRSGRYTEAESLFRKVIELTPDNAIGYSSIGAMLHLLGRDTEAATMLERSLAIKPTDSAYTNLGTVYYYEGHYAEAAAMMEKATEMGSDDYTLWGNLGDAYKLTPQNSAKAPAAYRRAIQLAQRQLAINPRDGPLRASLAVYWAKLDDKQKALDEIKQALRLAPDNRNVLFRSALAYELAGRRDRALMALEAALKAGYSPSEIRVAPHLRELRKDPRYQRLISAWSDNAPSARTKPN